MWKIERIVKKGEYFYAVVKDHPKRTKNNYVLLHRVIVENHLGRELKDNEIVHHRNKNKKDNRIENLEVQTKKEHAKQHSSENGHNVALFKCPNCGSIFSRKKGNSNLVKSRKGFAVFCSRSCNGKFGRKKQLCGLSEEMEKAIKENLIKEYKEYVPS